MANIYEAKDEPLHLLLDEARSGDGSTVLIPDLQRPYVWSPNQVILLVDSLIRGWPFGTLLLWRIGKDEIQGIPRRQFWQVIDKTFAGEGSVVARKDLGPISKLVFPWRHYKGNVGTQKWMAFFLIWGLILAFGSLIAFVAYEGP
jgi:hypothetical protein